MENKNGKNITIDQLARIINKGFDGQMSYMEKNFNAVNKNIEKIFNQLKIMDDKLDDVGSVKHRVDYIETALNIQPLKNK